MSTDGRTDEPITIAPFDLRRGGGGGGGGGGAKMQNPTNEHNLVILFIQN